MGFFKKLFGNDWTSNGNGVTRVHLWFAEGQPQSLETLIAADTEYQGDGPLLGHVPGALLDLLLFFEHSELDDDGSAVAAELERLSTMTARVIEAGMEGATVEMFCAVPLRLGEEAASDMWEMLRADVRQEVSVYSYPDQKMFKASVRLSKGPIELAPTAEQAARILSAMFWGLLADTARQMPAGARFFLADELNAQGMEISEHPELLASKYSVGKAAWAGHVQMRRHVAELERSLAQREQ